MILQNMAVCDLRCIKDLYLAERIEKISNVGLLILPEYSDCQVEKVLGDIKRENVAAEIYAGDDDSMILCILKGCCEFRKKFWNFQK